MLFSIKLYNFHHRNSIVHAYKSSAELNCGPPTSVRLPHLTAKAAPIRVLPFWSRIREAISIFIPHRGMKIAVSPPSSWRQADVHRTSAFMIFKSVRLFLQKETHTFRCAFSFWRYRPDLNWRITVLQTGALPLGYSTI